MKFLIFVFLFFFIGVSFIKRKEIALWSADPFFQCKVYEETGDPEKTQIKYSRYALKNKKADKALLILPPTGGKNILDEGYALHFCRKGFEVFILERWFNVAGYELDFGTHQAYQTKVQDAFEAMITNITERGYKDLNVLGTSAGGIDMNVTMGIPEVSSKIKNYFNIVSGVNLCKIIATTQEKGLETLRELRMKKLNISSMQDYEGKICSALEWDMPDELPEHINFGSIVSVNDQTVLTEFQLDMVKKFKPKVLIESTYNHFYTVVSSYFLHRSKIIKFFLDHT